VRRMRLKYAVPVLLVIAVIITGCDEDGKLDRPGLRPPFISPGITVLPGCSSAGLTGEIDPAGSKTVYDCEYGTTYGLEELTAQATLQGSTGPVEVTIYLTSLIPDTRYYFRFRASNAVGGTYGAIDTFSTRPSNSPPETELTSAVPDTTAGGYRIHLSWTGSDPDGIVAFYQWRRTDEGVDGLWHSTTKQDSTFLVDLNFTMDWQFSVRGVDLENAADPTPAGYTFLR